MSHPLTPREKLKLELRGGGGAPPRLPQRPAPPPAAVQPARPISSVFPETTEADRRRFGLATVPQEQPSLFSTIGKRLNQAFLPLEAFSEAVGPRVLRNLAAIPFGVAPALFPGRGFAAAKPESEQALTQFFRGQISGPEVAGTLREQFQSRSGAEQIALGFVDPLASAPPTRAFKIGSTAARAVGRQFLAPAGQVIDTPTSPAVQRVLGILKKTAPDVEKITTAQQAEQARRVGVAARRITEDPGSVLEPLKELGGPLRSRQLEAVVPDDLLRARTNYTATLEGDYFFTGDALRKELDSIADVLSSTQELRILEDGLRNALRDRVTVLRRISTDIDPNDPLLRAIEPGPGLEEFGRFGDLPEMEQFFQATRRRFAAREEVKSYNKLIDFIRNRRKVVQSGPQRLQGLEFDPATGGVVRGVQTLTGQLTASDIQELGELVVKGSRTPSDVVNNSDALTRLLAKGEVPQPADLRRLERLLGTEFVEEVVRIKRLGPGAWDHVADAANLPRALLSSADVSFGVRQGAMLGLSNPKQWGKAWVGQFKVMFSERKFGEMMKAIEADELFPLLEQSKVDLTQRVGRLGVKLAQGEERFQSSFAQIFPWVRGSERSYTMMANQLRSSVFYKKARLLLGEGKNFETHPEEFLDLGRHINWLTGRGPIPKKMQGIAPLLNGIFFAPRLFAGTVATPSLMFKGTQRAATAKALATFFAANGTILALANMHPDIDVEANPLSSDFGKMRIGKTRVHFLGPWQPLMVAISRVLRAGQRKTLGSGTIIDTDISEEVMAFFRNKLQPVSGLGLDISLGEDAIGREVRAANIFLGPGESIPERISEGELWQHTAGMAIQDTVDALIKEGPLHGLLAAPAFAGMAAQTFETSRSVREEETQRQFPGRKYDDLEFLEKQKVDGSEAVQRWFARRREEGPPPLRPQGELSFGMQRLTAVNLELEQGLRLKIDAGRSGQALALTIKDWKAARVNSAEALITPAAEQLIEERQQGDLERALRSKYWSIEVPENATTGELDFGAWKRQRDQVLAEAVAQGVKEEVILDRTGRFTDPVVQRVVEGYEADQEALREYYEIPEQVITKPELLSIYRTSPQFERPPELRKMAQLITRKRQVLRLTNCDIDALLVKWRGAKALCPGGQR